MEEYGDINGSFPSRTLYYKIHPNDENAKQDKNLQIRRIYYKNHPDNEDAKNDSCQEIREIYKKHTQNKSL